VSAPDLTVVIPLFNEVDNVAPLLDEVGRDLADVHFELILVDDGSTDGTGNALRKQDYPWLRLLTFPANRGQSEALYAGLMEAKAPVIATLDGDLQLEVKDILILSEQLKPGIDLVCGYRVNRQDSWSKRMQGRVANAIRRLILRDGVRDTGCALKVMRCECRDALVLFNGLHRFIPAMVRHAGHGLRECPVKHRARLHGQSKYGIHNRGWQGLVDLFGVKWLLARRPGATLRTPGKGT
jgi:dolichol-phosphate mannosyltransferase